MSESRFLQEEIEELNLKFKWVRVTIPHKFIPTGGYHFYGRLVRIEEEFLVLFSTKYGLNKIFLKNVLNIRKADLPNDEVE